MANPSWNDVGPALLADMKRIAAAEADGLDLARDSIVLERAIRAARRAVERAEKAQ